MKLNLSAVSRVLACMALSALLGWDTLPAQEAEIADDSALLTLPPEISDTSLEEPTGNGTATSGEASFREIELSPDGVVAFDSLGNRWYFDFDDDVFVVDPGAGGERVVEPEEFEAVEDRCTELKSVQNPELKAVFVGYDEYVEGDITAYDRVTVKGWVKGSIQSFQKRVLVTASGRVDGDIKAPEIEVKDGGQVLGQQIIIETYQMPPIDMVMAPFSTDGIWIVMIFTLVFLLIAFLAVSLAPRQLDNISQCISEHKVKTYFAGLLFIVLLPLLTALLVITIIGVVAVGLLPLSIVVALVMGMAASGRIIARLVLGDFFGRQQSLMFQSLFGVLVFMLLWAVVAVLLGSGEAGGVAHGFGVFMLVFSILITTYPLLTGLGAAVLTRFGFRKYVSFRGQVTQREDAVPMPAPPPLSGIAPTPGFSKPTPRPPSVGHRSEPPNISSGD